MIVTVGDLHLSNDRAWSSKVSNDVIDFLLTHPSNTAENILVLTGDVTDKSSVDGEVTKMLHRLFEGLKYKFVYICMGNHEGKVKNKKIALTYDFVEKLDRRFKIVRTIKDLILEEANCLFLPHIYPNENSSLKDYESIDPSLATQEYDLIFGHITDSRCTFPSSEKINISYLKTKQFLFGHIHDGGLKNLGYLGSVIPNSIAETDFNRYMVTINNGSIKWDTLPTFLEYKEVTYPNPLPESKGATVVWTVLDCSDENIARTHYKDSEMFIRKTVYSSVINKDEFNKVLGSSSTDKGFKFFLDDWLMTKGTSLKESVRTKVEYYAKK